MLSLNEALEALIAVNRYLCVDPADGGPPSADDCRRTECTAAALAREYLRLAPWSALRKGSHHSPYGPLELFWPSARDVVCTWCGRVLGLQACRQGEESLRSHGMCENCAKKQSPAGDVGNGAGKEK